MLNELIYGLLLSIRRKPRFIAHICLSILIYQVIRYVIGVSWIIPKWHSLSIVISTLTYIGLSLYLTEKIHNLFRDIAHKSFNINEMFELFNHLNETCFLDDIKGRVFRSLIFTSTMLWLLYYSTLILAISMLDYYAICYNGFPILTLIFDTYADLTLPLIIILLVVSMQLSRIYNDSNFNKTSNVFNEWAVSLVEDYMLNNCLEKSSKNKLLRMFKEAVLILSPLMLTPEIELMKPLPVIPLPRSVAEGRIKIVQSMGYRIELLKLKNDEKSYEEKIVPDEKEAVTIKDLIEKGILHNIRVAKVYKTERDGREIFLGYLFTFTAKLEEPMSLVLRHIKNNMFVCKTKEALTFIYLLAVDPRMSRFYMDLLLKPLKQPKSS